MTYSELPIINEPSQRFATTLAGRRVEMLVNYSEVSDRWSFDLDIEGVNVLRGRRVVCGVDLLKPFAFGIGALIAVPWGDLTVQPGREELPAGRVRLIHYDPTNDEAV